MIPTIFSFLAVAAEPVVDIQGCWQGTQQINYCTGRPCDVTYHVTKSPKDTYDIKMDVENCLVQCEDAFAGKYTATMTLKVPTGDPAYHDIEFDYSTCPPTNGGGTGKGQCQTGAQCCFGNGKNNNDIMKQGAWFTTSVGNGTESATFCQSKVGASSVPAHGDCIDTTGNKFLVKTTRCLPPQHTSNLLRIIYITVPLCLAICLVPLLLYWLFVARIQSMAAENEEKLIPESDVQQQNFSSSNKEGAFTLIFVDGPIGMGFMVKDEQIQVLSVSGQSEEAGVKVGDIIIAVAKKKLKPGDTSKTVRDLIKAAKRPMPIAFERENVFV
jgi:hypothetical protein